VSVADSTAAAARSARRRMLLPLALTQFIASFAGSNMNVAINNISKDLHTTIHGVQTAITLFLLCMAALMIPGSKVTDIWGRKRCLTRGLTVYGIGAVIAAAAPGLGILILGYSAFEGVGSALMIPPIYILATLAFDDVASRARAFGVISGMGGIGAAAGPLIGGLITTTISWRASFGLQAAVVAVIVYLSLKLEDPLPADPNRPFDAVGAVLSAAGMSFLVIGILQAGTNNTLLVIFLALGAAFLLWFFLHVRADERKGKEPLLSTSLFRNRLSNFGLVTQNVQWLLLMGITFTVSVFLQTERGFSAIKTGVIFTAATAGILVSSLAQERLAKRRSQRTLIRGGFVVTIAGIALLLGFVSQSEHIWAFVPGLLVIGLGLGVMLTPSVNVVQSAFPEQKQGEISGLSRSVSNLGSSLGTAIAGTILVADLANPNKNAPYIAAMAALAGIALIGFGASILMPGEAREAAPEPSGEPLPDPG
jgi:MFS family permease